MMLNNEEDRKTAGYKRYTLLEVLTIHLDNITEAKVPVMKILNIWSCFYLRKNEYNTE